MERRPAPGISADSPESSFRSLASSSSSISNISSRLESFDFSDYPPQSEWEEIPSLRWLPSELRPSTGEKKSETSSHRPQSQVNSDLQRTSREKHEKRWSEGYVPLCQGHRGKTNDSRTYYFKDYSGEKCLFLPASGLMVREDDDQRWRGTYAYLNGGSPLLAAELLRSYYLDIRGIIDTARLAPATEYTAFLIFRLSGRSFGFGLQEASLEINGRTYNQSICIQPEGSGIAGSAARIAQIATVPEEAELDGWKSVELGRFLAARNAKLLVSLIEGGKVDRRRMSWAEETEALRWKEGLVIGGIFVTLTQMDHDLQDLVPRVDALVLYNSKGFSLRSEK